MLFPASEGEAQWRATKAMTAQDAASHRRSLSAQQALRAIGVAFLVGLALGIADAYGHVQDQRDQFKRTLQSILELSRVAASDALSTYDGTLARQLVTELIGVDGVTKATLRFPDGEPLAEATRPAAAVGPLAAWLGASVFQDATTARIGLLDSWSLTDAGDRPLVGHLSVTLDHAATGAELAGDLMSRLLTSILQALAIGVLLAFVFHRFLTRPLRDLGDRIQRLDLSEAAPDPIPVPAVHRDNALGALTKRINDMVAKIAADQETLRRLSTRDALTSLPNRALVHETLEQAVARAEAANRMVAVLFLDIDRFKQINDTLGYDNGDQLLRAVGRRLGAALRPGETLGRLGGDEFLVIVDNLADFEQAASCSRRLERALAGSFQIAGHPIHIAASIGIALYPTDAMTASDLLGRADVAMYNAKSTGGGVRFFSNEMSERAQVRLRIETSLRLALEKQEFELYFQPKIDLRTDALAGCEALIRWRHQGELIPPNRFIPIAEQTALILPVGEWVLSEACRVTANWLRNGHWVPISVNVSARQVLPGSFVQYVRACIEAHDIPPSLLELEITETALVERLEEFRDIIAELRLMGVGISIDDFGTGYSSLAYVKDIAATTLKIDRHFVNDLPRDGTLVSVILTLARELGISVVAEGVESIAQVDWLKAHGCPLAQGHFFARALTEHQLTQQYLSVEEAARPPVAEPSDD